MTNAGRFAGLALLAACASAPNAATQVPSSAPVGANEDTAGTNMVPAGFGSLRQEDIGLQVALVGGVTARATPLDEGIIRLLSPDSYRSLHEYREGRRARLTSIARRAGIARASVWLVTFYGVEQGEASFSPQEVIITNAGRDFRPIDIVPLTPGFGEQRVRQRGQQSALYVFDGALNLNQAPLSVNIAGSRNESWGAPGGPLEKVERERPLVRSRAQQGAPTKAIAKPTPSP